MGIDFLSQVQQWAIECFGEEIAANKPTRNYRFLEEALELVQSLGCSRVDALQVLEYVYGRPVGDPHQEMGGVMVTLHALAAANELSPSQAGWDEYNRINTPEVIEKIRQKQKLKIDQYGVLPANFPAAVKPLLNSWHEQPMPITVEDAKCDGDPGCWNHDPSYHLNKTGEVAVADTLFYLPMHACPKNVTVLLLNPHCVATLGTYDGKDPQWLGWFPLPKVRK